MWLRAAQRPLGLAAHVRPMCSAAARAGPSRVRPLIAHLRLAPSLLSLCLCCLPLPLTLSLPLPLSAQARMVVGGAVKVLAGGTALTFAAYQTGVLGWVDEGSARSLRFWSAAFPVYLRYEFVQQRNKRGWLSVRLTATFSLTTHSLIQI